MRYAAFSLSLKRRIDLICSDIPPSQAFQRLGADPPAGAQFSEDDLLAARAALRGETAPVTAAAPAAAGDPAPSVNPAGAAPSAQPPSDGARCAVCSRCTPLPNPAAPPLPYRQHPYFFTAAAPTRAATSLSGLWNPRAAALS